MSKTECPECTRLREVYLRAIDESARQLELLNSTIGGGDSDQARAALEAAEQARINARDAWMKHQNKGHQ
jgi:hypothetical protein